MKCLLLAPFAFLFLPTCAVAKTSVSHDSPGAVKTAVLFLFWQMQPRGRHTQDRLCVLNRHAFVRARSVSIGAARESGRLSRLVVVFDAVCWDEETHKHFYVLAGMMKLKAHYSFFLCLQFVSLVPCITILEEEATYRLMQSTGTREAKWKQKAGSPWVICELCLWKVLCLSY